MINIHVYVFVGLECLAVILNIIFIIAVWSRAKFGFFLKWMLTGLVFVNLFTNAQCMALDVSMAFGIYVGWPVCFTQFFNAPFCVYATLMLVTCINFERIAAIKWPVYCKDHFTRKKAFVIMVGILGFAMVLSLLGLPDILRQYERSGGICLPTDIYPRRYATIMISTICALLLVTALTSFILNVKLLVKFSKKKLNHANNAPSLKAQELSRGALVSSRIAVASAFLYTWTIGYLVFFLFWAWITECDDMCFATADISVTAAIMQNLVTIQDPLVFFASNAKWSSVRKFIFSCGMIFNTNHVAPFALESDFQASPQPATVNNKVEPTSSGVTTSQRSTNFSIGLPLRARDSEV